MLFTPIAVKTSGKDLKASFKNTFETANAVKGMELLRAMDYLNAVIAHERCIPFRRFNKSMGRCSQAKEFKTDKGTPPSCPLFNLIRKMAREILQGYSRATLEPRSQRTGKKPRSREAHNQSRLG